MDELIKIKQKNHKRKKKITRNKTEKHEITQNKTDKHKV